MAKRSDQAARNPEPEARAAAPRASGAPHYSAEAVRGGAIVLRTRAERLIFIAGLVAAFILALFMLRG